MKTIVKYVVLKSSDYQLGTPLFQEELNADALYFDQIPNVISYQHLQFKVALLHKPICKGFFSDIISK
ncbi:hypothetical protein [uncultured Acinetobacter sp.]|uniref:hypothetical protein n=1 Tax=uncultured Acinetobacter sp. TaxID=165433 RepID=UPI00261EB622|nr:hypothetical protein [uncultured Acinetobacter sp.]